mmetsp:Transcript_48530/g.94869  ORF Transcript_48530/g.94869 Transcript_48530/m.94869 type:complete len:297 (+) Transcript_48530:64-954(+)|eukprot:CAMPEP_0194317742 /NCGR_PEP_ID=MMETSP0171-20130528/14475_1 /TAXON_ID=218684 /ORGANISM="Corethron pennatum, Strain L29A3" /LENGTH=296 /DNA_ID=CAMNT_0039074449 /DNA_START=45 /DNA_END=935 /DNA_ORIENTATION=-
MSAAKPGSVARRLLVACLATVATKGRLANAFSFVITGSGSLEVQLIAGKLAEATPGDTAAIIVPGEASYAKKCRSLLYDDGKGLSAEAPSGPALVSTGDDIGTALDSAEGLLVVCEEQPFADSRIDLILANSPRLAHVGLLSRHGGSLRKLEDSLKKKCDAKEISCSIVRAGILKGGGPGNGGEDGRTEWGLSKFYYNTIFDLLESRITMGFDKFTLGAKVTAGDPFSFRGGFLGRIASGQSFEPSDTDTGRTAAAAALLAAVRREAGVDVSLSTLKGEIPPSPEEWEAMFDAAAK